MPELPVFPNRRSTGVHRNAGLRAGSYFTSPLLGNQGAADPNTATGRLFALLFSVWQPTALDRIGIWLAANYGAGSLLRLGIYAARAGTHLGKLQVDAGTIDCTAGAPVWKELAIAVTLQPDLYMLVACCQAGWTVGAGQMIRVQQGPFYGLTTGGDSSSSSASIGIATGITGALPDPGPDLAALEVNQPLIKVRAA